MYKHITLAPVTKKSKNPFRKLDEGTRVVMLGILMGVGLLVMHPILIFIEEKILRMVVPYAFNLCIYLVATVLIVRWLLRTLNIKA